MVSTAVPFAEIRSITRSCRWVSAALTSLLALRVGSSMQLRQSCLLSCCAMLSAILASFVLSALASCTLFLSCSAAAAPCAMISITGLSFDPSSMAPLSLPASYSQSMSISSRPSSVPLATRLGLGLAPTCVALPAPSSARFRQPLHLHLLPHSRPAFLQPHVLLLHAEMAQAQNPLALLAPVPRSTGLVLLLCITCCVLGTRQA